MRYWTHDELHAFIDNDSVLKVKSDRVHALPRISSEEKEQGKSQMMEIYAEGVDCRQATSAKEFVRKAFLCMRRRETLDALRQEYAFQKLCHSSLGNDYLCFCSKN